jgi:hypothetical protein
MSGIKNDYKSVIFSGCAIESKSISLCDLRHFLPQYRGDTMGAYQVHSDNPRHKYSKIFKDIDEAVNKFVELKGLLK